MRMNEIQIPPSVTQVLDGKGEYVMMLLDVAEPSVHTCVLDGHRGMVAAIRVDDSPAEFRMGAPLVAPVYTPTTNWGQYSFVWQLRAPFSKLTVRTGNFGAGLFLRVLLSDVPFEVDNRVSQSGSPAAAEVYDGVNTPATGVLAVLNDPTIGLPILANLLTQLTGYGNSIATIMAAVYDGATKIRVNPT